MKRFTALVLLAVSMAFAAPVHSLAADEPLRVASAEVATININLATAQELRSLPGIGQVTAERIIAYRTENGDFTATDGLLKVKGVGKKKFEKIMELISVE